MRLTQIIEALLFASDTPLSATDLSRVDERLDEDTVEAVIQELRADYELSERSFQIYEVAGGYQLLTRPDFVAVLERYDTVPQPSRLSTPALEVLAIIAYRQPLGRAEIEDIRGVGSSGVLRTLIERNLVEPVGRGEGLGRPLLYGTTSKFLEHFGFRSLEDLPRPDELPVVLRERPAPVPEADPDASAAPADVTTPDAATSDALTPDATPDATTPDATTPDAGAPEAATLDSMTDAAASDDATHDAASPDVADAADVEGVRDVGDDVADDVTSADVREDVSAENIAAADVAAEDIRDDVTAEVAEDGAGAGRV
jgi:segregation and condensation protein B